MNTRPLANGGVPFTFIEGYFILNCWFCAIVIPYTALAETLRWRQFGTPALLVFLVLVNSAILLAIQGFILSRRGRVAPFKSLHFRVPAVLFGTACLVSIVGLFVRNA